MSRLGRVVLVLAGALLLMGSAVAAYDALTTRGVTHLRARIADLRDSIATRDANAALADEEAYRRHVAIMRLNAQLDARRDSLRALTDVVDSLRRASQPRRAAVRTVRGVDVDTLFIADTPHVVAPRVTQHVDDLTAIVRADSIERSRLLPFVDEAIALRDSLMRLDSARVSQVATRDTAIAGRDALIAAQDSVIAAKSSRCGRKCGMGLGAAATGVVVWLGTQLVRAIGGGS